jgi:DNA-3-methyladenine glycosylase II
MSVSKVETQRRVKKALLRLDPDLAPVLKAFGLSARTRGRGQPYESLLSAIAHQQLHGNAAKAILNRLKALADGSFPTPEQLLAAPTRTLRACGLSHSKMLAMQDLARHTLSGQVPTRRRMQRLSDEDIISRLTAIRGIGRWTVEMLLIFTLNRADVLPVDDFGVREGFRVWKGLKKQPKPKELAQFGQRWSPHRTEVALMLWAVADHAKKYKSLPF